LQYFITNQKKAIGALVLVLILTGAAYAIVDGNNRTVGITDTDSYDAKLYQYKNTYVGDNSKLSAIINLLPYTGLPVQSLELQTDHAPYGITVNYQVDSRTNYRFRDDISTAWNQNAAVMFSLITNADEIVFRLHDEYGEFTWSYYNRENLSKRWGMEYFTRNTVKEAANDAGAFKAYVNQVASIRNAADFYCEEQKRGIENAKQIYAVIGDDSEIATNSGVQFFITINNSIAANPQLKELIEQGDLKAEQYTGKKIEFLIYQINNFKTDNYTFYCFAFDDDKMIAYQDLKTSEAEQDAIRLLNRLEE